MALGKIGSPRLLKKMWVMGENTTFWNDPWLEGGLLRERFPRLYLLSLDKDGSVDALVGGRDGPLEGSWRWRRLLFQWELDQLKVLMELMSQSGFKGEGGDAWVWKLEKSSLYSVRSAYRWLSASDSCEAQVFYHKLWGGAAPLKIKAFVWKLSQDRIPSLQNLTKRNVPIQSAVCRGCNREVESAEHLFFLCKKFSLVWYECLRWWGLEGPLHGDCKANFVQFSGLLKGNAVQGALWELVWFATVWVILSSRNTAIFSGENVELVKLVEQIKLKTWLWITAKNSKFSYPVACWFSNSRECLGLTNGC